jgi:hypothetical protein
MTYSFYQRSTMYFILVLSQHICLRRTRHSPTYSYIFLSFCSSSLHLLVRFFLYRAQYCANKSNSFIQLQNLHLREHFTLVRIYILLILFRDMSTNSLNRQSSTIAIVGGGLVCDEFDFLH